ncbi:rho GTPase-activating protein gacZ-like [Ceratitis capitata]|uniref:rho GTPase-activating protein gacZ-like n=1 Tax=Ceratitis capitata TaxID=7213 RepID=UPI000A1038C6|nr:rho GTPase-activating protein gacZ-like [Ceratitis capitata]
MEKAFLFSSAIGSFSEVQSKAHAKAFKVFCGCILFGKGPDKNNTEGLRSALARLRNRTGPSLPPTNSNSNSTTQPSINQPTPPASPLLANSSHNNSSPNSRSNRNNGSRRASTATVAGNNNPIVASSVANSNSNCGDTPASAITTKTTGAPSNGSTSAQNRDRYVPGSPIFRDDCKTPPITQAPPSTPKSSGKGFGAKNFHAMTVSVTQNSTQGGATITTTTTTKTCTASSCYASTRSAAMMALALGHRPKNPATTVKNTGKNNTTNSNHIPSSTNNKTNKMNSNNSPPPAPLADGVYNKSPNTNQRHNVSSSHTNTNVNNRHTTVAAVVHMNGGTGTNIGFGSGGSASSGSDNDGFNNSSSSSATALRRFYFKSGRKSKMNSTATTSMTSIPLNAISTAAAAFHTSISGALPPKIAAAAVPKEQVS